MEIGSNTKQAKYSAHGTSDLGAQLCTSLEALSSVRFHEGLRELEIGNAHAGLPTEEMVFGECRIWTVAAVVEILFVWHWPL